MAGWLTVLSCLCRQLVPSVMSVKAQVCLPQGTARAEPLEPGTLSRSPQLCLGLVAVLLC